MPRDAHGTGPQHIALVALTAIAIALVWWALRGASSSIEKTPSVRDDNKASPLAAFAKSLASVDDGSTNREAVPGTFDATPSAARDTAPAQPKPSSAAPTGSIEGRVLFDGAVKHTDFRVALQRDVEIDGHKATEHFADVAIDSDGRYRMDQLEPGVVEVLVVKPYVLQVPDPIVTATADVVAGVVIQVEDLDTRGLLFAHDLTVVDEQGALVSKARGTFESQAGWNIDVDVVDGVGRILATEPSVDLWLGAPGRRCVKCESIDGPRTVVLRPALPVYVRCIDAAVIPADCAVTARLRSLAGATNSTLGTIASSEAQPFDSDGRVTLLAPRDEQYWVEITVERRSDGRRRAVEFDPILVIEVAEQLGSPFFDVPLTHAMVAAALAD